MLGDCQQRLHGLGVDGLRIALRVVGPGKNQRCGLLEGNPFQVLQVEWAPGTHEDLPIVPQRTESFAQFLDESLESMPGEEPGMPGLVATSASKLRVTRPLTRQTVPICRRRRRDGLGHWPASTIRPATAPTSAAAYEDR